MGQAVRFFDAGTFVTTEKNRSSFTIDISQGTTHISPGHKREKRKHASISWFFLGAAGQIGFAILIPLLLGVAIGIFIDSRFGIKPTGVLGGLGIGLILSIINLVRIVKELINSQPKAQ